jgi:hypothetical protein
LLTVIIEKMNHRVNPDQFTIMDWNVEFLETLLRNIQVLSSHWNAIASSTPFAVYPVPSEGSVRTQDKS